jgi:hypothetical protein
MASELGLAPVLLSHGGQILLASPAINYADDVSQHDRSPLFNRVIDSSDSLLACFIFRRNGYIRNINPADQAARASPALAPIGRHQDSPRTPDSLAGFLESGRAIWRGFGPAPQICEHHPKERCSSGGGRVACRPWHNTEQQCRDEGPDDCDGEPGNGLRLIQKGSGGESRPWRGLRSAPQA